MITISFEGMQVVILIYSKGIGFSLIKHIYIDEREGKVRHEEDLIVHMNSPGSNASAPVTI